MRRKIYRYMLLITFPSAAVMGFLPILAVLRGYGGWSGGFKGFLLPLFFYFLGLGLIFLAILRFLSKWLAKRVLKPLETLSFDNIERADAYDELSPFVRRLKAQKEDMEKKAALLADRSETISSITENMKEGLVLLNRDSTVISANKSCLSIFGAERDMTGRNIIELTRSAEILESVKKTLEGVPRDITIKLNGAFFNIFFNPVSDNGIMILFLDVTEKIIAETKRREFSANVSHELKTPLTTIKGYAEIISAGLVKSGDIAGFSEKIKDEAGRLVNLIDDIILLSELDESGPKKDFETFAISGVAKDVSGSLALAALEAGVRVELAGGGAEVAGNKRLIYDMLFNLLDNAIKYNRPGGKAVIEISRNDGKVYARVSDTGIGIPQSDLPRIFERFYRVDKSRSKKRGGTGLGLSIVKHIVMYHGGEMDIKSEIGKGTAITVILPGA